MPDTPYADLTEHKAAVDAAITDTNLISGSACIGFGIYLDTEVPTTYYLSTARPGYPDDDCGSH